MYIKYQMKTRRITKKLELFLKKQKLTRLEYEFLKGCLRFQQKIPQLTNKQWNVIIKMKKKYING